MLAFKDGVRLAVTAPAIRHLLETLDALSDEADVIFALAGGTITITSGNDSAHLPNSRHYTNEAVDLRAHNVKPERREWFREHLERCLNAPWPGVAFRVLHEYEGQPREHFHAQVRKGQRFPPVPVTT